MGLSPRWPAVNTCQFGDTGSPVAFLLHPPTQMFNVHGFCSCRSLQHFLTGALPSLLWPSHACPNAHLKCRMLSFSPVCACGTKTTLYSTASWPSLICLFPLLLPCHFLSHTTTVPERVLTHFRSFPASGALLLSFLWTRISFPFLCLTYPFWSVNGFPPPRGKCPELLLYLA